MDSEYIKLAYEHEVLQRLLELGRDNLLPQDYEEGMESPVVCRNLPPAVANVPSVEVENTLLWLERQVDARRLEMSRFTMVKTDEDKKEPHSEKKAAQAGAGQKEDGSKRRKGKKEGSRSRSRSTAGAGANR